MIFMYIYVMVVCVADQWEGFNCVLCMGVWGCVCGMVGGVCVCVWVCVCAIGVSEWMLLNGLLCLVDMGVSEI